MILTCDNLIKRGSNLVGWFSGEMVYHRLIHCDLAYALWSFVYWVFGIKWVLPKWVVDFLFAHRNWFGKLLLDIWYVVPLCLMWILWRERNRQTFEDPERSISQLESLMIRSIYDWSCVWVGSYLAIPLQISKNHFFVHCFLGYIVFIIAHIVVYSLNKISLLIQKQKLGR